MPTSFSNPCLLRFSDPKAEYRGIWVFFDANDLGAYSACHACLPAPAAGQCSHADIGASSDEDEGTVASAACMACMAVGAASIDGEPTDEQGAELLLACAPAASVGDCTAADFETVSTAEPSLSTACTSLRLSRPTTQHTPISWVRSSCT